MKTLWHNLYQCGSHRNFEGVKYPTSWWNTSSDGQLRQALATSRCTAPKETYLPNASMRDTVSSGLEKSKSENETMQWSLRWPWISTLQIGDDATGDTHDICWCSTEVVVPCSRDSPHLVVLQQVRINKHTKLSAVTERWNATVGLGNSMLSLPTPNE